MIATNTICFPPIVNEWLPEGHLARFIVEVIAQLDVSKLTCRYSGCGSAAYHLEERLTPDAPAPETFDPLVNRVWQLNTHSGRALYGQRKSTVEPVFGIIKQVLGFRQFSLRGLNAVAGEWKRVTMSFNTSGGRCWRRDNRGSDLKSLLAWQNRDKPRPFPKVIQ